VIPGLGIPATDTDANRADQRTGRIEPPQIEAAGIDASGNIGSAALDEHLNLVVGAAQRQQVQSGQIGTDRTRTHRHTVLLTGNGKRYAVTCGGMRHLQWIGAVQPHVDELAREQGQTQAGAGQPPRTRACFAIRCLDGEG
jgi:hypothetical protein